MLKKGLMVVLLLFLLFIPTAVAIDNETAGDVLQASNDYYFNASVIEEGNGLKETPFKDLKNNIKSNSVNHLSNGEYNFGEDVEISDVSFIGENREKTIINCHGEVLKNAKNLYFENVTLTYFTIINEGTLTAKNTVFSHGLGESTDSYGNSYGGAIYSPYHESKTYKVTLTDCIFIQNYAEYGGAIYMDGGELNILNTQFINNTAYNYGGSIACEYNTKLSINKTKFINSKSMNDAGGAIYLKLVDFDCKNIDIINSTATFGGAITALNSNLLISYFNSYNNTAKYNGGGLYQLYGQLTMQQSYFINNTARNGAGLFLNNLTKVMVISNQFQNNTAILCGGAIYSIANPKLTYQNRFSNNKASTNNDLYETSTFDIKDIGGGNYTIFINEDDFDGVIPSTYNLKDHGYVSSIKSQQYGGNCWAFASLAALESCILKASGKEYDLSEENMKNLIELYSDYGWAMDTNEGGYNNMAIGYLTSWLGPVNESDDYYDDYSTLSPLLNSLIHVQNVLFLKRENYSDNDAIKKAIMKYGAVSTGICYYSEYLNGISYYCNIIFDYPNHAVSIVGWDDNYPKSNFRGNPEIDGAWIVKNSWGESWGDGGYFYVSYCDKKLAQVGVDESSYTFIFNDSMKYDKNYQYDVIGKTNYFSSNPGEIYYQNTFTSTDDEILTAVSTHFQKTSNWDLSIYVNDILRVTQTGLSDAGYYTIRLNEFIHLNTGDKFKIIFRLSGEGSFSIPVSEKSYTNKFLSNTGLSFFSYDGNSWFDLYTSSSPSVASIKAFTLINKINTELSLKISDNQINPVEIVAEVFDEYGNIVKSGNISFKIEDIYYSAEISNGIAKLYHNFTKGGLNSVIAEFESDIYNKSINLTTFNVNITDTFLIVDYAVSYFNGLKNYSVKLIDNNSNPIANKKIVLTVNGVNYENITDLNGIAVFYPKLNVGDYLIQAVFPGDEKFIKSTNSSKIQIKPTIIPASQSTFTLNSNVNVKLLDIDGSNLKNAEISVLFNSKEFKLKTNNLGEININIDVNPGEYLIKITNQKTGEVVNKIINVALRITGNKNINTYIGGQNTYKIRIYDDNGNPISNANVKVQIAKKTYTKTSDKNGYVTVTLGVGKYTVISEYMGFKVSNKMVVKSTLTAKNKSVKKGKTLKFSAKLVNTKGKALKGKKITFKIKGKKYTAKTNKKGVATIKVKKLKLGKYKIKTSYGKVKITNLITVKR